MAFQDQTNVVDLISAGKTGGVAAADFNNRSGVGARIRVHTPLGQHTKIVTAGHGRGESNGSVLLFGLGVAMGVDSVVVGWPRGTRQVDTRGLIDQEMTIVDSTELEIYALSGFHQIVPNTATLDYLFTWKTTTWSTDSLDALEIEGAGETKLVRPDVMFCAG